MERRDGARAMLMQEGVPLQQTLGHGGPGESQGDQSREEQTEDIHKFHIPHR